MNRLSLNSDGAFLTTIHRRIPHTRNRTSTKKKKKGNTFILINLEYSKKSNSWVGNYCGCSDFHFVTVLVGT